MQKDPIASAIRSLELATQELHDIMDHTQAEACGTFLQTREVLQDLHRATQELKEATEPPPIV